MLRNSFKHRWEGRKEGRMSSVEYPGNCKEKEGGREIDGGFTAPIRVSVCLLSSVVPSSFPFLVVFLLFSALSIPNKFMSVKVPACFRIKNVSSLN